MAGVPPAELAGLKPPAQHDGRLHVLHHQTTAPRDLDEVAANGAVDRIHPWLLGVAVGVDQPGGSWRSPEANTSVS